MCVLKIYSDTQSFLPYAQTHDLPPHDTYEKGAIRRKKTRETYDHYRIAFDTSNADWDKFPQQVEDTITYLRKHRDALLTLMESHAISGAYLDFALWSRMDEVYQQNDDLPVELIRLAGEIGLGITLAQYHKPAGDADTSDT